MTRSSAEEAVAMLKARDKATTMSNPRRARDRPLALPEQARKARRSAAQNDRSSALAGRAISAHPRSLSTTVLDRPASETTRRASVRLRHNIVGNSKRRSARRHHRYEGTRGSERKPASNCLATGFHRDFFALADHLEVTAPSPLLAPILVQQP